MADPRLAPRPPLDGLDLSRSGLRLRERTGSCATAIALPAGEPVAVAQALQALGLAVPEPGRCAAAGAARVLRTALDQLLLLSPAPPDLGPAILHADQTGAFALLDLSGPRVQRVLERLVMLDTAAMRGDDCARTLVAHLPVLLVCLGADRWWLLAPASAARSLADAVATAMQSVD